MLLAEAGEKEFFEVLPIIFLVFAYPDDAVLDDVGHNYFGFVRLSTLVVWILRKCYMQNEENFIFRMEIRKTSLNLQALNGIKA